MVVDVERARAAGDSSAQTPTVASLAREWAARAPRQVALRDKDFGIWRELDWASLWDLALDAAHGLLALGVDVGERVSIHSEDRPEWLVLDLASVAVRAVTGKHRPGYLDAVAEGIWTNAKILVR